ncbi:MAG TPA: RDD family protein [Conexibacter sp.]
MNDGPLSTGVDEGVFGRGPAREEPEPEPPSEPVTYELASWGVRAAAYLLDSALIAVIPFAVGVTVLLADGDTDDSRRLMQTLVYAVGIPIAVLYAPLLLMRRGARNGQTIGKQALGIRVVRENGEPVSLGNGLMREVIGRQLIVAFTYGIYAIVDYLLPVWDRRRQCLHDKVVQTRVVRLTPSTTSGATLFTTKRSNDRASSPVPVMPSGLPPAPPLPPARPEDDLPVRGGWLPPRPDR